MPAREIPNLENVASRLNGLDSDIEPTIGKRKRNSETTKRIWTAVSATRGVFYRRKGEKQFVSWRLARCWSRFLLCAGMPISRCSAGRDSQSGRHDSPKACRGQNLESRRRECQINRRGIEIEKQFAPNCRAQASGDVSVQTSDETQLSRNRARVRRQASHDRYALGRED